MKTPPRIEGLRGAENRVVFLPTGRSAIKVDGYKQNTCNPFRNTVYTPVEHPRITKMTPETQPRSIVPTYPKCTHVRFYAQRGTWGAQDRKLRSYAIPMSSLCPEAMDYQQPSHNHNDSGDKPRSIGPNSSQVHTHSLLRSTRHMGSQRPTLYPPEPQWTNQSILMSTSTSTQYVKVVRPQPSAYPRGEGLDTVMMVVRRKKGVNIYAVDKPTISHMIVFH